LLPLVSQQPVMKLCFLIDHEYASHVGGVWSTSQTPDDGENGAKLFVV